MPVFYTPIEYKEKFPQLFEDKGTIEALLNILVVSGLVPSGKADIARKILSNLESKIPPLISLEKISLIRESIKENHPGESENIEIVKSGSPVKTNSPTPGPPLFAYICTFCRGAWKIGILGFVVAALLQIVLGPKKKTGGSQSKRKNNTNALSLLSSLLYMGQRGK